MADRPQPAFYQTRRGSGGGGNDRVPPPPPPPNRVGGPAGGGGPGGPPRGAGPPRQPMPQQVMPREGYAMQSQQMVPPPPREIMPPRLQQRPAVEMVDIRLERLSPHQIREYLSSYTVYRFEKDLDEDGYDLDGRKSKPDWKRVVRTRVEDTNQNFVRQVRRLQKKTKPMLEKKEGLDSDQQRQLEKALEELNRGERDQHYYHELVQIDQQVKRTSHHGHHHHKSHSRHHRKNETLVFRVRSKSRDSHKKHYKRISLTGYYKRCPRPEANVQMMWQLREQFRNTPPHIQQAMLQQQHQQQQHQQQQQQQHQQQQRQQMGGHMQPRQGDGHPRPGVGGGPARLPGPPKGKGAAVVHSDSDSESSWGDSNSWDDDDSISSQPTSAPSSKQERGRKGTRYNPGHFGQKPTIHRRHSRHDEFPPRVPAPPRVQALLPAADMERALFEAGKEQGRVEERRENEFAEEIAAQAAAYSYRPRQQPRPRIIQAPQRRSLARLVDPNDLDLDLEDDFRRRFDINDRYDDRSDDRYEDRYDDRRFSERVPRDELNEAVRRRSEYERQLRDEDALLREERRMEEERRERQFRRPEYLDRADSPPAFRNPFTPHAAGTLPRRRNTVSYETHGRYYP